MRLWRPLEEAGFHDVADHAALVVSCATDPARPRRELDQALAGLHHAAANLASLVRQYREAADQLDHEVTVLRHDPPQGLRRQSQHGPDNAAAPYLASHPAAGARRAAPDERLTAGIRARRLMQEAPMQQAAPASDS